MAPNPPARETPDLTSYTIDNGRTVWGGPPLSRNYVLDKVLAGLFKSQNDHPFMFSNTYMSDAAAENDTWLPAKMLGSGSFGKVGLWSKVSPTGDFTDHVVIKQAEGDNDLQYKGHEGLAKEAVFLMQMNGFPAGQYTVYLRRYKYFPSDPSRWRFYFEYAPHGDLERLRWRYRFWDRFLPEVFIWHVFDKLAQVTQEMALGQPPWTDFDTGTNLGTDNYLLHFDMKPANVLLAAESRTIDPPDPLSAYPSLKVADFGQAELMDTNEQYDPETYGLRGTPGFRPPEQLRVGEDWRRPPNDYANPPFSNAHNVWSIAKVIYDLMTLSEHEDLLPDNEDDRQRKPTETLYYSVNARTGYGQGGLPISWSTNGVYSQELEDLIRNCLNIDLRKRPSPQELATATSHSLAEHVNRVLDHRNAQGLPGQAHTDEKVYFRGTEINEASQGDAGIPATEDEIEDVNDGRWRDLDQPKLKPPPGTKWDPYRHRIKDDLTWTQQGHQQWHEDGDMVRFVPPQPSTDASQAGPPVVAGPPTVAATAPAAPVPAAPVPAAPAPADLALGPVPAGPPAGLQGDALRLYQDTHASAGTHPTSLYDFMVGRHKARSPGHTAADWLLKIHDGTVWQETGALSGLINSVINVRNANTTRKQAHYALHFRNIKNRNNRVAAAVADLNTMYGG